jgi:hypothetical protein
VDVQRGRRRWRWRHLERRHIGSGRSRPECGDRQAQSRPNAGGHKLLEFHDTSPFTPVARSTVAGPMRAQAKSPPRPACAKRDHQSRCRQRRRWIDAIVPRLRFHLSQGMCHLPQLQRRSRKSVTSLPKDREIHWLSERRKFERSDRARECTRAHGADLI